MMPQHVTDCSLWRWAGQDYSLCEEPGNVSADERDWSSDDDVTTYESSLIYMLNNAKLICKSLSDCCKHQCVESQSWCQFEERSGSWMETFMKTSEVKTPLKLLPTENNKVEYGVVSSLPSGEPHCDLNSIWLEWISR